VKVRIHRARWLLAIAFFVAAFASSIGAVGATATAGRPRVMTCTGATVVKPTAYTISCADANSALAKLHWTIWVKGGARATGTFSENDCTPYCAAGKFISYPAKVALSGARTTAHGLLYTRLTITYTAHAKRQHFSTTLPTTPL
jgi:hypothetical protein